MSKCSYCGERTVVGVLDAAIAQNDNGGGNKYRRFCMAEECHRWQAMTSREHFWTLRHRYVLPADADADNAPDSFEPLDEQAELELIGESYPVDYEPASANTNTHCFECPACDTKQVGYPAACRDCGVEYRWPSEADKQETEAKRA